MCGMSVGHSASLGTFSIGQDTLSEKNWLFRTVAYSSGNQSPLDCATEILPKHNGFVPRRSDASIPWAWKSHSCQLLYHPNSNKTHPQKTLDRDTDTQACTRTIPTRGEGQKRENNKIAITYL